MDSLSFGNYSHANGPHSQSIKFIKWIMDSALRRPWLGCKRLLKSFLFILFALAAIQFYTVIQIVGIDISI